MRLAISSAYLNIINFLLVDIVLSTAIIKLTSDLAGLCNSVSALAGFENTLRVNYSSLFGVGLICTRRRVFRFLALLRVISIGAVMATNFFIEGKGCDVVRTSKERMLVPGIMEPRPHEKPFEIAQRLIQLRKGCMGHKNGMSYYGELGADRTCELHEEVFTNTTIFWGLKYFPRKIQFPQNCVVDLLTHQRYNTLRWRCDGFGQAACMAAIGPNPTVADAHPLSCRTIVKLNTSAGQQEPHLCKAESVSMNTSSLPGSPTMVWLAKCRLVKGIDVNNVPWPHNLRFIWLFSFDDVIHGTFTSDVAEYTVRRVTKKTRHVSLINYGYFYAVGVMTAIIFFLAIWDLYLRCIRGLRPAGNDELGLYRLLRPEKSASVNTENFRITSLCGGGNGRGPVILVQERKGVLRGRVRR